MDNDNPNRDKDDETPYDKAVDNSLRLFIKEFRITEMQQIAMMVFAEYTAMGGDLSSTEDMRRMREIVEEAYVGEEENRKMIAKGVNELRAYIKGKTQRTIRRKAMRPLPRRRNSGKTDLEDEVVPTSGERKIDDDDLREEIEELEENRYALTERRLPVEMSGLIAKDERRHSVIRRLNDWNEEMDKQENDGKKQA